MFRASNECSFLSSFFLEHVRKGNPNANLSLSFHDPRTSASRVHVTSSYKIPHRLFIVRKMVANRCQNTHMLHIDENECKYRPCDVFAHCTNTMGSFYCSCFPGYDGDGFTCHGKHFGAEGKKERERREFRRER